MAARQSQVWQIVAIMQRHRLVRKIDSVIPCLKLDIDLFRSAEKQKSHSIFNRREAYP